MRKFTLKNGLNCIIEEAKVEDALEIINYTNQVAGETDNLTFGHGEFRLSKEDEEKFIATQQNMRTSLFLVARANGKIVGSVNLKGNLKKRMRHTAEFGITVLKEYWGLGIGKLLMGKMIKYAKRVGITKINLKVRSDNRRAIKLYQKLGFEREGLERHAMKIKGEYVDFVLMGLLLD